MSSDREMTRRGRQRAGLFAAVVGAAACNVVGDLDSYYFPAGPLDGTTSTSSSGASGGAGTTGSGAGTGSGAASSGGGAAPCDEAACAEEMNIEEGVCVFAKCAESKCQLGLKTKGEACSGGYCNEVGNCLECVYPEHCANHPISKKCRADGKCVECLSDGDCVGTCQDSMCVAATCNDMEKNNQETGKDCGGPDCGPCPNGEGCASFADCASKVCNQEKKCQPCGDHPDCPGGYYCDLDDPNRACRPKKNNWESGCDGKDYQCKSGKCTWAIVWYCAP